METLTIVNPVAEAKANTAAADRFSEAPRPKSLEGKRVGLFWNAKSGGDVALKRTREHLSRLYPTASFTSYYAEQGTILRRASGEQLQRMAAEVDAMVGATGD